jgi:predicted nucleic acid-binding protein
MRYVLDASVALKWVLPEADSDRAIRLQEDFENQIHELLAPDTFPVEIAHALTRAERRGLIQPPEALRRFQLVARTLPHLQPYVPLLPRAIELSSSERIGVYDCLYIALAERERCKVVSADLRLVNTFPSIALPLSGL